MGFSTAYQNAQKALNFTVRWMNQGAVGNLSYDWTRKKLVARSIVKRVQNEIASVLGKQDWQVIAIGINLQMARAWYILGSVQMQNVVLRVEKIKQPVAKHLCSVWRLKCVDSKN